MPLVASMLLLAVLSVSTSAQQAEVAKVRIAPFRTAQGKNAQILYVDWKNIGTVPIGDVRAEMIFYSAKGEVLDRVDSYCIFTVCDEAKTIKPGQAYRPQGERGFVILTKIIQGAPATRAEVRIVRATGFKPC